MEIKRGTLLGNRYRLLDKIETGTAAHIRFATDELLGRRITVKIIHETGVTQFYGSKDVVIREANMSARLQHPNIIPIYDLGEQDDLYFLIMGEFTHSLSKYMQSTTDELTIYQILEILRGVAGAMDYMHAQNIVHRNLKPQNILLTVHSSQQIFSYISDFGIAALDINEAGTRRFMAPEQLTAMYDLSGATDLYAFGIVAYEVFTGKKTFEGGASLAMVQINAQMSSSMGKANTKTINNLPSVREHRSDLPTAVDVVLSRLTRFNPSERYSTATEAIVDLNKAIYSTQAAIEGKIFISYARKDSEYVHKLAGELRRIGLDLWIDQDIEPGSNWDEAIENGLNECDMMLLITTEASMTSEYVTHEWSYFMGRGKPVYPFIPQTPIPNNIHPRLSRVQHVVGTDDMLNNVARIVDVLAGGRPTKLGDTENQG